MLLHTLLPLLYNFAVTVYDINSIPAEQRELENLEEASKNMQRVAGHMFEKLADSGLTRVAEDLELMTKNLTIEKGYMREKVLKQNTPGRCKQLCQLVVFVMIFGPMVASFFGYNVPQPPADNK